MTRETIIRSPFTGGMVEEVLTEENRSFRGETYPVHVRYYRCRDTGETFTDSAQDDQWLNELYSQYRVNHGIPFPSEIRGIRERYGLTRGQISTILGFGENQYSNYERGQMPSDSNGKMISAAANPDFMLAMLESSRFRLGDDYDKVRGRIESARGGEGCDMQRYALFGKQERSIFNGFGDMDVNKAAEMIRLVVSLNNSGVASTKLNKELFYCDFAHYAKYGRPIAGFTYRALQYGPAPEHYDTIFDHVEMERMVVFKYDNECVIFMQPAFEACSLSEEERGTITEVCRILAPMPTKEVIDMSHEEDAWTNHYGRKEKIPYSDAFALKGVQLY